VNAALALYALRAARPRQLAGRALRPIRRRRFPATRPASLRRVEGAWASPAFAHADSVIGDGAIDVLGLRVPFPPASWVLPGEPRLRQFHLHYGEEALGWARRGDAAAARRAMEAWIRANPPRAGDAWHPYVVSQRLGNWIGACSLVSDAVTAEIAESVARQARYLARNVEDDILGNHVIANGRALVLAGVALGDASLARRGDEVLRREVPEQVLPDGGHHERSPVYHLLVLRDLLDARAAASVDHLDDAIERMSRFAAALRRPDGLPAPFNDAPLELAPALELPDPAAGTTVFPDTGYAVVRAGGTWLAFDCGPPCPPHLPPHAHADVLSFQLWQDGQPVVVDPGTSTYEAGTERDGERSTRAHSTVTVDGRDQFELWGAFRSGPLPRVRLLEELEAEVRYDDVVHRRRVVIGDEVVVEDDVHASGRVEARLPLARRLEVDADDWEQGTLAARLYEREPIPVAVRYGTERAWRLPRLPSHP
jgi:uncharacterized heparinase superfamily protein